MAQGLTQSIYCFTRRAENGLSARDLHESFCAVCRTRLYRRDQRLQFNFSRCVLWIACHGEREFIDLDTVFIELELGHRRKADH